MKTFLLPLALLACLTASVTSMAASTADLADSHTRIQSSGLHANGRAFNGMKINGLRLNGVTLNGIQFNGLRINGVTLNGARLNGIVLNGLVLNGRTLNGTPFDGSLPSYNFVTVAPATAQTAAGADWSSLALANVRVRLPLAR